MTNQETLIRGFDAVRAAHLHRKQGEKWQRHAPEVLPAFIAEMDFPVAEPILVAMRAQLEHGGDLGYPFTFTSRSPLHYSFACWARDMFGWTVEPEKVVLFPDTMRVVEVALEQFTRPGDAVVVDIPAYPPFLETVQAMGRVLLRNPMRMRGDAWQPDFDGLQNALCQGAAAYLLCNPHNPTGRMLTAGELRRVLRLARRTGAAVIADEVFSTLPHPGQRHVPISTLPEAAEVSIVSALSASKGWNISGLRCALAVLGRPADFETLMAARPRARDGVGALGVTASAAAFTAGGPWLRAVTRYLHANSRLLSDLLRSYAPEISYVPPEAGFLAWLDCRRLADRLGSPNPARLFLDHGHVAVSDGGDFGREGFVRLAFGTSQHVLRDVVGRMEIAARRGGDWDNDPEVRPAAVSPA